MARRTSDEGPKAPVTKAGLKKFLGIFRFVLPYRFVFIMGLIAKHIADYQIDERTKLSMVNIAESVFH